MLRRFKRCIALEGKYIQVENGASYFIERDCDKLNIYFEWSNGLVDWLHNFYFPAKPYRKMKNLWFCHRGFLKVWKTIEPYISKNIMDESVKEIDIVGYSHGAAIAQLCYEYVKFNRPEVTAHGVGFGSPRVVWGIVSKAVKTRFEGFKVVRNGNDIVTHLPPVIFGFRHICEVIKLGTYAGSKGMIDDHRDENYLDALEFVYGDIQEKNCCAKCCKTESGMLLGWELREGKNLCPDCVKEYDEYVKKFYL